jgi:hypothetical protein
MALIKSDRVKETSTSTGNGTFSLAGAATGYRTFASVCVVGDTFFYGISNQTSGEWETGLGTYSATNTLTRTTVHASSNSGAIVTFGAGTKEVFLTASARYLERIVDNELFTSVGSSTSVVAVNDGPQPQLDLAFSADKTLTARYGPTPSYSRASTGTVTNSSGVLTSAAVNEPRFDHVYDGTSWVSKGLLVEEQRTNLCPYSEQISDASWNFRTNVTVVANSGVAPDGTTTADLIYPTANGSSCEMGRSVGTVNTSLIYTNSFFLKSSGKTWARVLSIRGDFGAWFNLSNGTVGTTLSGSVATIQNAGNGWYRCSVTRGTDFSTGYSFVLVADADNSNSVTASGANGILVWGAQSEQGSFPTSYIPTTTAAVTRSADVCQITGGDFSGFWNASEGSFAVEYDRLFSASSITNASTVFQAFIDGSNDDRYALIHNSSGTVGERFNVTAGNVEYANLDYGVSISQTSGKSSTAYRVNDFALSVNGGTIVSDTSGPIVSSANKLNIGQMYGSNWLNGHIARLRYYNTRLANQTLVQLSGGINNLVYKSITGSGNATVANNYTNINVSVPNPLPVANGGTGAQTQLAAVTNLISNPPNDGGQYTLASKKTSGTPSFYWVDSTGYAPTLDLLFAADKSLTAYTGPTPSYSRASTGTYFNASGVLTTAAINGPRFDHVYNGSSWLSKGLLVEEQRTNNLRQSNTFNTTWVSLDGAVVANSGTSPDGTNNAWKLNELATTTVSHGIYQTLTIPGGACTWSIFAKAGERSWLQFLAYNSTINYFTWFNLANGTVGTNAAGNTATITPVGNGWYRCSITRSAGADYAQFYTANGDNNGSYLGEVGKGIYIFGAQVETGSFPTSYIPTTTAAVTRSADVCQITGGDFSGFWNASEGSYAVEFDRLADHNAGNTNRWTLSLTNGSTSYIDHFAATPGGGSYNDYSVIYSTGSQQAAAFVTSLAGGVMAKSATGWKVNDFAASFNGGAVQTDSSVIVPVGINRLDIGMNGSNYFLCGHIARLRYYPVRIPNATLQVLST